MSNSWLIPTPLNLPLAHSKLIRIKTQPSQNQYCYGPGYETRVKNTTLYLGKPTQRSGSKPKLEYIRFQGETSTKKIQREKEANYGMQQTGRHPDTVGLIKSTQEDHPHLREQTRLCCQNNQKHVFQKQRSNKQKKNHGQNELAIKIKQDHPKTFRQKLQITFNIESTEPQEPQKQKTSHQGFNSEYYCEPYHNKTKINKQALQVWKKRKMERDMRQKQAEYRTLIRSLSKQQGKQRFFVRNKMKEVLDDLFKLQKAIIRNS